MRTSASVGFARMSTALFALLSVASMTAIWSILSLISGGFGGYMALIVAVCIVLMLHNFGYAPGFMRALAALVLMSLSIIYQTNLEWETNMCQSSETQFLNKAVT